MYPVGLGLMAIDSSKGNYLTGEESLAIYTGVFEKLAIFAVIAGILLLFFSPKLLKLMNSK